MENLLLLLRPALINKHETLKRFIITAICGMEIVIKIKDDMQYGVLDSACFNANTISVKIDGKIQKYIFNGIDEIIIFNHGVDNV